MNKKEEYKQDLKKIGNETLDDLEPIVKKSFSNIFDFVKKIVNDGISLIFEKRKISKGESKWVKT